MKNKKENIEAIVLDVEETMLVLPKHGVEQITRKGLVEFLDKYSDKKLAVFTDSGMNETSYEKINASNELIKDALKNADVYDKFEKLYFGQNMSGEYKNLDLVAYKLGVAPENLVIIGDSDREVSSAKHYGTHFIKVTKITEEVRFENEKDDIAYAKLSKYDLVSDFSKLDIYEYLDSEYK